MVEKLLSVGAKTAVCNAGGRTALDEAMHNDRQECIDAILKASGVEDEEHEDDIEVEGEEAGGDHRGARRHSWMDLLAFLTRRCNLLGRGEVFRHILPVDDFPNRLDVVRAQIFVLQVVRVLPDVDPQKRASSRQLHMGLGSRWFTI